MVDIFEFREAVQPLLNLQQQEHGEVIANQRVANWHS
jgi:hypothetical protein